MRYHKHSYSAIKLCNSTQWNLRQTHQSRAKSGVDKMIYVSCKLLTEQIALSENEISRAFTLQVALPSQLGFLYRSYIDWNFHLKHPAPQAASKIHDRSNTEVTVFVSTE